MTDHRLPPRQVRFLSLLATRGPAYRARPNGLFAVPGSRARFNRLSAECLVRRGLAEPLEGDIAGLRATRDGKAVGRVLRELFDSRPARYNLDRVRAAAAKDAATRSRRPPVRL